MTSFNHQSRAIHLLEPAGLNEALKMRGGKSTTSKG